MAASGRVLVLSAAIGEGHDLPARWLAAGLAEEDPAIEVEIAEGRADVVVSTYPGVTEILGRLRVRRRRGLGVPVVSAITDLASLRYWAHPGVDLHLVTHPESIAEVRAIAGEGTDVVAVRGL